MQRQGSLNDKSQLECRAAHLKIYMRPFSIMANRSGLSSLQSISHTSCKQPLMLMLLSVMLRSNCIQNVAIRVSAATTCGQKVV